MSASEHYQVRRELARGGMGAILEATDQTLDRDVAMKVMLEAGEQDPVARQRFVREALVLARLEHPNIVPIHELGRDAQGRRFYTMKLVKGRTLQAIITAIKKGDAATIQHYTLDRLLTIYRKVCDAIAFAHHHRIIHRDLKPENVMVGEFGEVLVMDWGLAKHLDDEAHTRTESEATAQAAPIEGFQELSDAQLAAGESGLTMEGTVMGSPQYMPPEQAEGRLADLGTHSDIYSLGGILYAILTLRHPVEGRKVSNVLLKVISGEITPPTHYNASRSAGPKMSGGTVADSSKVVGLPHCPAGKVPASLSAVTMRAMALRPEDRYADVLQIVADVEAYQGGFATSAEQAGTGKQFVLFLKRNKAASIGAAAVLLVGGMFGTKAILAGQRAEREAVRANQALADLKRNAPALLALAESEAVAQHHESALEKTDVALRLDPSLLPAYWRRAWGLVALGRFSDAAAALRVAGERDPANVRTLGSILPRIEKLAALPDEAARFAPEALTPVFEFMQSHGAVGEAGALIQYLRLGNDQRFAIARERLKAITGSTYGVALLPSGLIELNYISAKLKSLEQVRGIPFDSLLAKDASIESLEPLRGLRLTKLYLDLNRISDLAPLHGMALVDLSLYGNPSLSDLAPLAGLPLRKLSLFGCGAVVDLTPLRGMMLEDLSLDGTRVNDLGPLAGMPLRRLNASGTPDLSPLAGLPLESLSFQGLSQAPVERDLSPLAGLPLKSLNLGSIKTKDLTPLLRIAPLERLTLDAPPATLAPLRQHPRLAFISYKGKGHRPVAQFWKEFDAEKAGAK